MAANPAKPVLSRAAGNPCGISSTGVNSLGYKDSNLEMTESESVALPFGDSPLQLAIIQE